jgi:hypothetical protein
MAIAPAEAGRLTLELSIAQEAVMHSARYVRLFSDDLGESHFEDLELSLTLQDYAPPAAPLNVAPFLQATGTYWVGAPVDWSGDVLHPTPRRQLICTVEGEYEITASDGEVRCFPAGSVLLVEDTSGKGHSTKITYNKGALVLVVDLAEENSRSMNE